LLILTTVTLIVGCSAPLKQVNTDAKEFWRSPTLPNVGKYTIAFLTTAVSKGSGLSEYRLTLSDIMERTFSAERPYIKIIPSRETINRINSSHLTVTLARMLEYYDITGILEQDLLKKIGNAIGARLVAQPKLLSFSERTSTRLSAFGLALVSTRETTVKLSLQLWDVSSGKIVWEGTGQATVAVEALRARPVTFEEVAETASRSVVSQFPE